ncbi:unnamed protein product [Adineta ricciae]|uniref:Uncharacterized protein n=1 Tax=Adineta ricciae TaxID=249248 RepID=A0A815MZ78_ADIRI|nr:unnamed protein product [Adineta ricciae]
MADETNQITTTNSNEINKQYILAPHCPVGYFLMAAVMLVFIPIVFVATAINTLKRPDSDSFWSILNITCLIGFSIVLLPIGGFMLIILIYCLIRYYKRDWIYKKKIEIENNQHRDNSSVKWNLKCVQIYKKIFFSSHRENQNEESII